MGMGIDIGSRICIDIGCIGIGIGNNQPTKQPNQTKPTSQPTNQPTNQTTNKYFLIDYELPIINKKPQLISDRWQASKFS